MAPAASRVATRVAGAGGVPRLAALRPRRQRGLRLHPERRRRRAPSRVDSGRLRVRGAHRDRPPVHRSPGERQAGRRWRACWTTAKPWRCSPPRPRTPGRPATGWASSKSPRARTKIRQWFAKERREDAIEAGKTALDPAMRKAALPMQRLLGGDALLTIARDMHLTDVAALYAAVGRGPRLRPVRRAEARGAARRSRGRDRGHRRDGAPVRSGAADRAAGDGRRRRRRQGRHRRLGQARPMLYAGARRRHPRLRHPRRRRLGAPPACTNAAALLDQQDRLVEVEWGRRRSRCSSSSIQVEALDRHRLLSDVSRVLSDERVNILSAT